MMVAQGAAYQRLGHKREKRLSRACLFARLL